MKKTNKILSLILLAVLTLTLLTSCGDSEIPDGYKSVSPEGINYNLYVPKSWVDNSACGTPSAVYSSSDKSNVSMTAITADESFTTLEGYLVYADACLRESLPEYALIFKTSSSAVSSGAQDSEAISSSAVSSGARDSEAISSSAVSIGARDSEAISSSAVSIGARDPEAVSSSAVAETVQSGSVLDAATDATLAGLKALSFDYTCRVSGVNYRFRQIVCLHSNMFYVFTYTAEEEMFDSHTEEVAEIVSYITFR